MFFGGNFLYVINKIHSVERVSGAASNGMNSLSWVLETEAFQTEATISYGIKSK